MTEREQRLEWLRRRQSFNISSKRREHSRGNKAAKSICVGVVEGPGAPEEVADVHQKAVEVIDVFSGVFVFGPRWRFQHDCLKGALVCCEEGAEAGQGAEAGVEEDEEVYRRG